MDKTITLEDVRDWLRDESRLVMEEDGLFHESQHRAALADAIDAYLDSQPAEQPTDEPVNIGLLREVVVSLRSCGMHYSLANDVEKLHEALTTAQAGQTQPQQPDVPGVPHSSKPARNVSTGTLLDLLLEKANRSTDPYSYIQVAPQLVQEMHAEVVRALQSNVPEQAVGDGVVGLARETIGGDIIAILNDAGKALPDRTPLYATRRPDAYTRAEVTDRQIACIAACLAHGRYVSEATARNQAFLKTLRHAVAEAALASPSAGAVVPEGWKAIPHEPAQNMLDEAFIRYGIGSSLATAMHKAMYDAAPEVPQP